MTGDRWTLLLLKGERSPIRQISFSQRAVHLCVGGVAALVVGLTGVAAGLGVDGAAHIRARQLARENAVLSKELTSIQGRVSQLEGGLGELAKMDSKVRLLAGLDSIDAEVMQAGVGGPSTASPESSPLWAVDSTLSKSAFAVRYDLNALERRATVLKASLNEAADSLTAQHDLLESTPSILPTTGIISSGFSKSRYHPIHQVPLPHEGIDIAAVKGTPIFAAAKGVVVKAEWENGYGQMVEIDHGYGYTTRYGHTSRILVKPGDHVKRGDPIALVGNTGIATAPHLHYEVRVNGKPQNPVGFVIADVIP